MSGCSSDELDASFERISSGSNSDDNNDENRSDRLLYPHSKCASDQDDIKNRLL